jgi:glycosyltransferase involved in cell wall biosynthesis
MNIAIDLRPLIGGKSSGVKVYTRNLVQHLIPLGHEHTFILWINAASDQSRILSEFKGENVITIQTRIPNKILNFLFFFLKRPRLDKLLAKKTGLKIDTILLTDLRPAAFSKNTKKICVIHDLSFHHFPHFFKLKTRLWHKLLNARKNLNKFDSIIAVSNFTKKNLSEIYRIPPGKIKVIHEGPPETADPVVNEENFAAVRKKYSLPPKYFLFLSTIEPRKNIQRMIDAFAAFKKTDREDIKLVIAGTSNPKIFARQKIRPCDAVIFTGFIAEEDKPYLYFLSKAFIYPSIYEGFGLPLLEAMRQLTPIIASNTSSIPEICGDAALLFSPFRIAEMTAAMHQITERETREYLKREMLRQIKQFSWHKCAAQTLNLLESI